MAYGATGKSAAMGYTDFSKGNSNSDSALENSADASSAKSEGGSSTNMVKARKMALKKRLLKVKGN